MSTERPKHKSLVTVASVVALLLGLKLIGAPEDILGATIPEVLKGQVVGWTGLILLSCAIWLWGLRSVKQVTPRALIGGFITVVMLIVAVTGLKFTSVGSHLTDNPMSIEIQNDGYSVTGGVMLLIAGFVLGYLLAKRADT